MSSQYINIEYVCSKNSWVRFYKNHLNTPGFNPYRGEAFNAEFGAVHKRVWELFNQKSGHQRLIRLEGLLKDHPEASWEESYPTPESRKRIKVFNADCIIEWV